MSSKKTDERLGCNLSGRLAYIQRLADQGQDDVARQELLAVLRFFPKRYWPHDCAECQYLGSRKIGPYRYDAYSCPADNPSTVLLRYGPAGSEYESSVLDFAMVPESQIGGLEDLPAKQRLYWREKRAWVLYLKDRFGLQVR